MSSLNFANFVDSDEAYGHRRDAPGYVGHINGISGVLEETKALMRPDDLLIVTSDHGNDPTHEGHTNHTRERTPLLVFSPRLEGSRDLGVRTSFADVGQTLARNFGITIASGTSFLDQLR